MAGVAKYQSAGELINRVAVSVGLNKAVDPFVATDPSFVQLVTLANEVGQTLMQNHAWNRLIARRSFTTAPGDTGIYDLPDDFGYMIDQTGWQQGVPGSAFPLLGPATAQGWSYLTATALFNVTIYAWFIVREGKLQLWPQPPAEGIPIQYDYVSRGWAIEGGSDPLVPVYTDTLETAADTPLFEPILFVKGLKLAFLQAKGFDTVKAQDEFNLALDAWCAKDQPAPTLNLHGTGPRYRFLDGWGNLPETGFGN